MAEYIDRDAFVVAKRKQYCEDCERRKGMKNGKLRFCYEIGDAPCRSCGVDDMLGDIEDFPAADVRPVVRGEWEKTHRHTNSYRKYTGFDEMGEEHTITVHEELEYDWLKCPYCGASAADNFQNFCPNCGARMDGDADAEE